MTPSQNTKEGHIMKNQTEMFFAKELWKLILEIEDFVRNHYQKLVEQEIYDLHDDNDSAF
jgi:hypothetical protein